MLNLGGGGLASATTLPTGAQPNDVAAGDLNGDHVVDFVTPNRAADSITVLLSQPGGDYARSDFTSNGIQPSAAVLVDLTGDGVLDLVVVNEKVTSTSKVGNVVSFVNDGTGVFTLAQAYVRGRETPKDVCAADFDGDGHEDVAVASAETGDILILLGRGDGTWSRVERSLPVGGRPVTVFCNDDVDIDGDGHPDVVFGRRAAGSVDWIKSGT